MPEEPSGVSIWSPKIANEALVRKFISRGGRGYVAIAIQDSTTGSQAVPVDPDPGTLTLNVWFNDVLTPPLPTNPYGTNVLTVTADSITRIDTGMYFYELGPAQTANRGLLTAIWTYTVGGTAFQFIDHLQILDPMPLYDSLSDQEKYVVEQVSWMFGDLYDSTEGGPHLIEEFQTHWNYERIAQMQQVTVMRMNMIGNYGNPPTTWAIGSAGNPAYTVAGKQVTITQKLPDGSSTTVSYSTPSSTTGTGTGVPAQFAPLVVMGTYIECMRHLARSYTEIPQRQGMDVTFTDRQQYQQRWMSQVQDEYPRWEQQVKRAKMSLLGMSRGKALVAGGIYGGSAMGIFQYGQYAAQVRSWRMYPAAPAIMWGATHGNS
jgi:hypothetical protein